MSDEEFYDEEIAPALFELARKCEARGIAMIAQVEYDCSTPGNARTEFQPPSDQVSISQKLVHWAARCQGNVDLLFMALVKHSEKHGHNSIYLRKLGCKNTKP